VNVNATAGLATERSERNGPNWKEVESNVYFCCIILISLLKANYSRLQDF